MDDHAPIAAAPTSRGKATDVSRGRASRIGTSTRPPLGGRAARVRQLRCEAGSGASADTCVATSLSDPAFGPRFRGIARRAPAPHAVNTCSPARLLGSQRRTGLAGSSGPVVRPGSISRLRAASSTCHAPRRSGTTPRCDSGEGVGPAHPAAPPGSANHRSKPRVQHVRTPLRDLCCHQSATAQRRRSRCG